MEQFYDLVQQGLEWLNSGQYGYWQQLFAYWVKWAIYGKIQFILWALPFTWGIAASVLDMLNVSQYLNDAWASLDSYILGWLTYLRIPDAINILINAFMTRVVLRFLGWGL